MGDVFIAFYRLVFEELCRNDLVRPSPFLLLVWLPKAIVLSLFSQIREEFRDDS